MELPYQIICRDTTQYELQQQISTKRPECYSMLQRGYIQEYENQRKVVFLFPALRECFAAYIQLKGINIKCTIACVDFNEAAERARIISNDENAGDRITYIMEHVSRDQRRYKNELEDHRELAHLFALLKQKE